MGGTGYDQQDLFILADPSKPLLESDWLWGLKRNLGICELLWPISIYIGLIVLRLHDTKNYLSSFSLSIVLDVVVAKFVLKMILLLVEREHNHMQSIIWSALHLMGQILG